MKQAVIRSTWMDGYGYRLDCSPYLGGALETKVLLEKLPLRKDPLYTLTAGFDGGIYNGPKFSRTWVKSPEYGVPFVGGSAMLYADFSGLPFLSKKQAHGRQLRHLELQPGMSLISCSGTIGNMAYARPEMAGMWSSQHIMKVVPDTAKVPSGYLYAYLSSKFGIPLIVSGTYGSIIQSIGPGDLSRDDFVVPRLGDALEHDIHALVEEAAELRTKANKVFSILLHEFEERAGLPLSAELTAQKFPLQTKVLDSELRGRLDVNFHSYRHYHAIKPYLEKRVRGVTVGELAESVVEPKRFKRIEHNDPEHSAPLYGTGDIGNVDPQPISRITAFRGHETYAVGDRSVLIPRSGQLNGVIGTATLPIGGVRTGIISEHAIRISCRTEADTGYLFLALRSQTGYLQLKARAFGSSIPTLDVASVSAVLVPELTPSERNRFGTDAFEIATLRHKAIAKENLARTKLVAELELAAKK